MWDDSQLKLALGGGAGNYGSGDAKSIATSTDVGESLENGDHDRSPLGLRGAEAARNAHRAASQDGNKRISQDSEVHKELQALQKEYLNLLQDNDGLREQVATKDKELQSAYHQIGVLAGGEKTGEKEDVGSMAKQLQDFAAQNSELALGFSKLSEAKSEADARSETLRQSNEASDGTIRKLTEKLRNLQKDLESMYTELEESKAQTAKAEAEVKALRTSRARDPNELEESFASVSKELIIVKEALNDSLQEQSALECKVVELYSKSSERTYMGALGGAASTLILGGLYQLCAWGRKR